MVGEFRVKCDDAQYRRYFWPAGLAAVVYPLGIPFCFAILLWADHNTRGIEQTAIGMLKEQYEKVAAMFDKPEVLRSLGAMRVESALIAFAETRAKAAVVIARHYSVLCDKTRVALGEKFADVIEAGTYTASDNGGDDKSR